MTKLGSALALIGLLSCSACLGASNQEEAAPAPSASASDQPRTGSPAQPWAEFVATATGEGLPRRTWPSTAKNAGVTAAIMCHNPASHGATEVDLYHGSRDWAQIRRGDILFARAFCPEAEVALTRALSGRPGAVPDTAVPA